LTLLYQRPVVILSISASFKVNKKYVCLQICFP
jgi:hypothetical protein